MPDLDCPDTINETPYHDNHCQGSLSLIANESFLTARQRFMMLVG